MLIPRYYQAAAIDSGIAFFNNADELFNGLLILTTGSGKSLVIANISRALFGQTLVLQPSKEILEQNYAKFMSYGGRAGIYSASAGQKVVDKITYATIGSIHNKRHLFRDVKNIIVDECHYVNPDEGMYIDVIRTLNKAKVLGLTATPYRLTNTDGVQLEFLTRTKPRVFDKVLYYVQNQTLFNEGHLAKLEYFNFNVINRNMIELNASGTDFTEASLRAYYSKIDLPKQTTYYCKKILQQRSNILVFCSLIPEAKKVSAGIPGSCVLTGNTELSVREKILSQFKSGKINCLINVGVLTTGFDMPELESVLIARSTMSLALYYQIVGRVMRPYTYPDGTKKVGWVVDLGGNVPFFGKIETMKISTDHRGLHVITNEVGGRIKQLTNITFTK